MNWNEKYRPKSLDEIVGYGEIKSRLINWAESWKIGNVRKKAIIFAGPPGVGKTTMAIALANDFGWDIVEMNASDERNYSRVKQIATTGANYETFTVYGDYISRKDGKFKLILLDEADCLFGNEDRGGIHAITETITTSVQPIILTVNEYYALTKHHRIRNLCELIKFRKLTTNTIKTRLKYICEHENVDISSDAIEWIAEHANGDLRGAICDLQSLAEGKKRITKEDVYALSNRDVKNTIFGVLREIFRTETLKTSTAIIQEIDETPEKILLWVEENVPAIYREKSDLYHAYESLSRADLYLSRTSKKQNYGLWRYANTLMTGGVSISKSRMYHTSGMYSPPEWLSHMSKTKTSRKVHKSLLSKLSRCCHCSSSDIEGIYSYIKTICKNNLTTCINLVKILELDREETAYLLDEDTESKKINEIYELHEKTKQVSLSFSEDT